jgi:HK97 family phage prohead protease
MMAARFPDGVEFRAAAELRAAGRRLEGYAAVFDVPARIGNFTETIKPGAFVEGLRNSDVLALVDHDPGRLLARTRSGTLRLSEDRKGLSFSLDVPDTTLGHDVLTMVQRGDVGGMSFGFHATDEAWPTREQRELRVVQLVEISIVHAHPAYSGTEIAARARIGVARVKPSARLRLWLETV